MSQKEVDRVLILNKVKDKLITLKKAASLLSLSYPQAKRLWSSFQKEGPKGLISKKRGRKSNRAISEEKRKKIVQIISNEYQNCKPLFVSEKLEDRHGIKHSSEFIRRLMIEYKLWFPKEKKVQLHQRRQRRECEGELVQVDASDHDWFEGRGPRCHLHMLVDDATSKIMGGYFGLEETTEGYYRACQTYFENVGRPISLYTDKRGTFVVNKDVRGAKTQFARAMGELDIKMITAHSPQAKGRIERAFGTLQERLVWEMRIKNISTIEEANGYLPDFFKWYNKKFSKEPANPFNAHRLLDQKTELKYILCKKEERKVSNNLELSYNNQTYQLNPSKELQMKLKKSQVTVITTLEGEVVFQYEGNHVNHLRYNELEYRPPSMNVEKLVASWERGSKRGKKPSKDHPWKRKIG